MPPVIDPAVKAEAFRLRTKEELGLKAIAARTGIAKSTLSLWFRDLPLPKAEIQRRMSANALVVNAERGAYSPPPSAAAEAIGLTLSRGAHRVVSVTAVRYRLEQLGYTVAPSPLLDQPTTLLVSHPRRGHVLVRVKTAGRYNHGRPTVKTVLASGRRLTPADGDLLVAYDLETDTAFVFPVDACEGAQRSCQPEDAEAWQHLGVRGTHTFTTPVALLLEAIAREVKLNPHATRGAQHYTAPRTTSRLVDFTAAANAERVARGRAPLEVATG